MSRLAYIALVVASSAGCLRGGGFACAKDGDCGTGGMCEAVGYCSFADPGCGRRFGEFAGPYSNLCVNQVGLDGGTDGRGSDGGVVSALRILCGAPVATPDYTDSLGHVWSHDIDFDIGSTGTNADTITNSNDSTLFHYQRWAKAATYPNGFKYTFGNLAAGNYTLTLKFAETLSSNITGPNQRLFNVVIDGMQVLTSFDIYAEAGGEDLALDKTFDVTVQSPPLVLQFTPGSIQNPKCDAIEIVPR